MSLPSASQPWRPKNARPTNQPNNNNNNNNIQNNNNSNPNSRNGSFETDGQISNRTGNRGQSHIQQQFQKFGNNNGQQGGYNNNNIDSSIPLPQSRGQQQQQAKAAAAAAAAAQQNQPQSFNVEDALDAFENIKVSSLAERATDWAPVSDSGVTYAPVHKDMASFYRLCSDAQKNKK